MVYFNYLDSPLKTTYPTNTMETNHPFVMLHSPEMSQVAQAICAHIKTLGTVLPCYELEYTVFANGEIKPRIPQTIRGQHVFYLQDLQYPNPNIQLMKMLITNDAIMRSSASGITEVMPYFPYLRQDRKDEPRVPITARMVFDLIESNHAVKSIITMDMHVEQAQGFSKLPVDNLAGRIIFAKFLRARFNNNFDNVVILAPDFGGAVRNKRLADELGGVQMSILQKKHTHIPNETKVIATIGPSLEGRDVVMYDDIIDSGGTAIGTMQNGLENGARSMLMCATQGIFSKGEEMFRRANVSVVTTDSIPRTDEYYQSNPWLIKLTIAPYFGDAIYQSMQIGGSISKLEH